MALWTASAINTNETAMVFNKLVNKKAEAIVRKKNGLLYQVLGKKENGSTPNRVGINWDSQTSITGRNLEVKLRGKNITPNYTADGAAEVATVALTHVADIWGAAEFPVARLTYTHPIPHSELDRFAGEEAKTLSYMDEVFDMLGDSFENLIGNALNTAGAPARTLIGGYPYAIATDNTYGTIDRTDVLNVDFRGTVVTGVTDLTLAKIRSGRNLAKVNGGFPRIGVAETTIYTKVETLVEAYTHIDYHEDWALFGSEYVGYNNVMYTQDQRAPAGELSLLDPDTWVYYRDKKSPFTKGIINDPSRVSTYVVQCLLWIQFICKNPSRNLRMTGITS